MPAAGQAAFPAAACTGRLLPVPLAGVAGRLEAARSAAEPAGVADGEPGDADTGTLDDAEGAGDAAPAPPAGRPPAGCPAAALPYAAADTWPLPVAGEAGLPPVPEQAQASSPITPRPATRVKNRRRQYASASRARPLLRCALGSICLVSSARPAAARRPAG
jgi:hypothetical protein